MWTQRDHIQAYRLLRRRLVSALVAADADHPLSPSRRLVLGQDGALHPVLNYASARLLAGGNGDATVTVSAEIPLPVGARAIRMGAGAEARVAVEVYVPPSGGTVVTEIGSATTYPLTDMGMKYPVANAQALAALGYGSVARQPVTGSLLALVPRGPALDPVTAGAPVPSGGTG